MNSPSTFKEDIEINMQIELIADMRRQNAEAAQAISKIMTGMPRYFDAACIRIGESTRIKSPVKAPHPAPLTWAT